MKRNLKEDDGGRMEYLKALEDALEAENYLCTWGDEPLGKLIVDTDLGMFDIDYVPGEWVYVVHFSGPNREFTKYRKYTDDVVEIVVNVVEDQLDDWSTEHYMESKKESTLDLFGQNAKVHKDKNWKPVKKQIKERRMPYSEISQVEDYVGTARAKGFECIEGTLVSKAKEVFTPVIMKFNGNVEARLRIFSQGNYTIFTDKGGWEGLDLEEFEKDLDDLLTLHESVSKKSNRIKEAADENVELKIGDIVDFKVFGKYDSQAKVTEIGKIRGGFFAGRPYVEAYESWGNDHAPGSTAGHNFCFMKSVRSGEWADLDNEAVLDSKYWPYLDNLFGYNKIKEASKKSKKSIKEDATESVSGLKWYQRGDTFKPNWGDNFIDAKAVDTELDAIVAANGGNEFQIKDPKIKKPLSFKIKGWYNFNGDNVEVELIFNREFEDGFDKEKWGTMHGDMASCESHYVEDWLNEHLEDFGFEDYEVVSSGWDKNTHTPTKGIHWYKYSMKNKDNTHKMPNYDDWTTGNSNLNGTEPFTKEEGKEIDEEVANCIAELMKANPKGVYGKDVTATPEDMENLIIKVRPTGVTWRGSYTHNYGYFAFEIDVKDYYDSEKENWRGQKGTTWGASEDDITSLLKWEAADALNDFLYEFNLEVVPDDCKAQWYHGSREDVTYLEFDVYFKEIGIDPYKSYKAHSGNSFKDYWDGSEPKDLYKGKTFKRNPKRVKESVDEDDAAFKEAKSYIKKSYQKYVHKLSIRNGKVDALSLQNFLSEQIGRKLNFHTANGKMFWELSEEEANIEDVNVTLNAYSIRTDLYGRNYDKVRIYINQGSNLKKIDTSCWNKNVRAYRAGVEQNADPVAVELSNIIMPLWNKTKFPGIQSGEIYKSAIMKTKPGTPNIIGSTLDLDRVEALGNMLKREGRIDNVVVEPTNDVAKRVRITFEYNYHKVEILAMVAQFVCQVELSIDCK